MVFAVVGEHHVPGLHLADEAVVVDPAASGEDLKSLKAADVLVQRRTCPWAQGDAGENLGFAVHLIFFEEFG